MDKQMVLDQAKSGMAVLVTELELGNIEEIKEKAEKYFEFVEALSNLPIDGVVEVKEDEVAAVNKEREEAESEVELEPLAEQEEFQNKRYRFERKLRGGVLPNLEDGYFIPEMMVRDMGIGNGDELEIIDGKPYGDQIRYTFRIIQKGAGVDPIERAEFKYCVVESMGGRLCVKKQVNDEDLKFNGVPFSFVLKDNDVQDLRLSINDIIDIAYYINKPDTIRVVWKHDSSAKTQFPQQTKQVKKETVKVTVKQEKELPINDPQLFNGKKILVVGAKPKEAGYKAILETLGSKVEVYAGTEAKSRTRGAIQRSDVVVMVTAYLGHGKSSGSPQVVDMCKKAKIPFGFVDSMGNESFIRGVEEVLKRKEEL